jgi:hypothetical protein
MNEAALRRNAEIDAQKIEVMASEGRVTLTGTVRTWVEREDTVNAAWSAPGVRDVVDRIRIHASVLWSATAAPPLSYFARIRKRRRCLRTPKGAMSNAIDAFTTAPRVACFSMEIALRPEMPTYAGGLGVLAGDLMCSVALLGPPGVMAMLAAPAPWNEIRIGGRNESKEKNGSQCPARDARAEHDQSG